MAIAPISTVSGSYINSPTFGQKINNTTQVVALYMQTPIHYASELILRSVGTIIHPGKGGNLNSYTLEVIRRIFATTLGVAIVLVTLPLTIIGIATDKVTQWTQSTDFTHWRGSAPEVKDPTSCKLMTLNSCSMWGGMPYLLGGCRPPRQRMAEMAKKIQAVDPDIVVLQEMSFPPSHKLYGELEKRYAHFFTRIGPNVPLMESGLFVASKHAIVDAGFLPFPGQWAMHRGAFWVETDKHIVFTTHLQFGDDETAKEMRADQLRLIREKMDALEKEKGKPSFLIGDFNLDRRDPAYKTQIQDQFYDPAANSIPVVDEDTSTCTDRLEPAIDGEKMPERPWEYIDYTVCTKAASEKFNLTVSEVPTYDVNRPYEAITDHKGMVLEVTRKDD